MSPEAPVSTDRTGATNQLRDNWSILVGAGAVLVIFGVLAVVFPFVTGVALAILLGGLLIGGGIVNVAHAFASFGKGWSGFIWQSLLAIVYALGGILLIANPTVGLASLTLLLIVYFAVDGVVEMIMGLSLRGQARWGWLVASGAVSLVLAALLWAGLPGTAAWSVGLLFGLHLVTSGIAMMLYGWDAREAEKAAVGTTDTQQTGA